ncbi:SPL family radical SAM protein [Thomasclavelia cocleata]|uniref:SPL family radical SAM protein n=1 Tax=Thomasclavelia cocleata TaxID=69824 RepID=UPI0024951954|nr:radical SAM protein [Thomasclavelia cocleata]
MKYQELEAKSALNKVKGRFPFKWDLNIYRGCEHGCIYCYAIYSHKYLNDCDYFETIYYKKNILSCLEKKLSSPTWKHEIINIGGVCDSYQPLEEKLQLMPEILKLMIKYKTPIIISTKSSLILRDLDLINELSKITYVNIACTIITVDDKLRSIIEPGSSSIINRFRVIDQIKKHTNASTGIHIMPIIPYLTDHPGNINGLYKMAKKVNADYVLPGILYLRGPTRSYFFNAIKKYDYHLYKKISSLYYQKEEFNLYKKNLYSMINQIKKQYNIDTPTYPKQ